MSPYGGYTMCPCCGDDEVDRDDLMALQARQGGPVRMVCADCYEDAMRSDRRVWDWYWHD
jgi:hypothetical protein